MVNADAVFRRRQGAAGAAALDYPGQCAAGALRGDVAITDAGGDSAASRVILVGLGLGLAGRQAPPARINEINGGLFVDQVDARLDCGLVQRPIARLRGEDELMAQVFVWRAQEGRQHSAMAYTQRRARTSRACCWQRACRATDSVSKRWATQAASRTTRAVAAQPPHRGALPPGRETAPPARA